MVGKKRNPPEEIQYILDLHRQGLSKLSIVAKCNERFKRVDRTGNSVHYVLTKYKKDPKYAPKQVAPAMHGNINPLWIDATGAFRGRNIAGMDNSASMNGSEHAQRQYHPGQAQQVHQANLPRYQGRTVILSSPEQLGIGAPSMICQVQGDQFHISLGGNSNTSYQMDSSSQRHIEPAHQHPTYSSPSQQQSVPGSLVNNQNNTFANYPQPPRCVQRGDSIEMFAHYPSSSNPVPAQQAMTYYMSASNGEDRKKQVVQAEATRPYQQMQQVQATGQPRTPQQSLPATIDPRMLQIPGPPTYPRQGYNLSQPQIPNPGEISQNSSQYGGVTQHQAHNQQYNDSQTSQLSTYPTQNTRPAGASQNPSSKSNARQIQNTGATNTAPPYPSIMGYSQCQNSGRIRLSPNSSSKVTDQHVQYPTTNRTFQSLNPSSQRNPPQMHSPDASQAFNAYSNSMGYLQSQPSDLVRPPPKDLTSINQRMQQPATNQPPQNQQYRTSLQVQIPPPSYMVLPPFFTPDTKKRQVQYSEPAQADTSTTYLPQVAHQPYPNGGRLTPLPAGASINPSTQMRYQKAQYSNPPSSRPSSTVMNHASQNGYQRVPKTVQFHPAGPSSTSTNYAPQFIYQQTSRAAQLPPSPNPMPHINQPYQAQTTSSPKARGTTPKHTLVHDGSPPPPSQEADPDFILFRPSKSGQDYIYHVRGAVYNKPIDLTPWSVIFPPCSPPPPGSEIYSFYKPDFSFRGDGRPFFSGTAVNQGFINAVAADIDASPVDVPTGLGSDRPSNQYTAPVNSPGPVYQPGISRKPSPLSQTSTLSSSVGSTVPPVTSTSARVNDPEVGYVPHAQPSAVSPAQIQATINIERPRNTPTPQPESGSRLPTAPKGKKSREKAEKDAAPASTPTLSIEDRIKAVRAENAARAKPVISLKYAPGYVTTADLKKRRAEDELKKEEENVKKFKLSGPSSTSHSHTPFLTSLSGSDSLSPITPRHIPDSTLDSQHGLDKKQLEESIAMMKEDARHQEGLLPYDFIMSAELPDLEEWLA